MSARTAILGMGRVGRDLLRCLSKTDYTTISIIADFNEPTEQFMKNLIYLLKYESNAKGYQASLSYNISGEYPYIQINGKNVRYCQINKDYIYESYSELPCSSCGIDLVVDCTGAITSTNSDPAETGILASGAKKYLIVATSAIDSLPAVTPHKYPFDSLVHAAVLYPQMMVTEPIFNVLNDKYTIAGAWNTYVKSGTNEQSVLDNFTSSSDFATGCSSVNSIFSKSWNRDKVIGLGLPPVNGKVFEQEIRVPSVCGNLLSTNVTLSSQDLDLPTILLNCKNAAADAGMIYTTDSLTTTPASYTDYAIFLADRATLLSDPVTNLSVFHLEVIYNTENVINYNVNWIVSKM